MFQGHCEANKIDMCIDGILDPWLLLLKPKVWCQCYYQVLTLLWAPKGFSGGAWIVWPHHRWSAVPLHSLGWKGWNKEGHPHAIITQSPWLPPFGHLGCLQLRLEGCALDLPSLVLDICGYFMPWGKKWWCRLLETIRGQNPAHFSVAGSLTHRKKCFLDQPRSWDQISRSS